MEPGWPSYNAVSSRCGPSSLHSSGQSRRVLLSQGPWATDKGAGEYLRVLMVTDLLGKLLNSALIRPLPSTSSVNLEMELAFKKKSCFNLLVFPVPSWCLQSEGCFQSETALAFLYSSSRGNEGTAGLCYQVGPQGSTRTMQDAQGAHSGGAALTRQQVGTCWDAEPTEQRNS